MSNLRFQSNAQHRITSLTYFDNNGNANVIVSNCHPKDQFCKKTGWKKCIEKYIKLNNIPKNERANIWNYYFENHNKKLLPIFKSTLI